MSNATPPAWFTDLPRHEQQKTMAWAFKTSVSLRKEGRINAARDAERTANWMAEHLNRTQPQ